MGCGIYMIHNSKNGKIYIGSSNNIKKRWDKHIIELITRTHYNERLQKDWNEYGREAFDFKFIEDCSEYDLRWRELKTIDLYSFAFWLYNQKSIKDEIIFKVGYYLEKIGAKFTIDLPVFIGNKKYKFNIYALVNGIRIFINLRDESFFHDKKAKEKAAVSFAKKAEWVASENGYITEFYYSPDIDDDSVNKIVADIIDYIELIAGSEINEQTNQCAL